MQSFIGLAQLCQREMHVAVGVDAKNQVKAFAEPNSLSKCT